MTPNVSLKLHGLSNASNDPTPVDTNINKESVRFEDKIDKHKEETSILKAELVDNEKRAISAQETNFNATRS